MPGAAEKARKKRREWQQKEEKDKNMNKGNAEFVSV